jgi:hypothetical protein
MKNDVAEDIKKKKSEIILLSIFRFVNGMTKFEELITILSKVPWLFGISLPII